MHRQKRTSTLGDSSRSSLGIEVESDRIDVGKHRPGPLVQSNICRGDKRERASDNLIPFPHPNGPQRQVQPSGATRNRTPQRRVHKCSKLALKRRHERPERKPPGPQHPQHSRLLLLA